MPRPIVSIIMPAFNGARYLRDSIGSVLTQGFTDWELIIVNDASTDQTENIIREFAKVDSRIVYLKNETNQKLQRSLNRGLDASRGEFIARLDDDDVWMSPDKLSLQIRYMHEHRYCVLVGTWVVFINKHGHEIGKYQRIVDDATIRSTLLRSNQFTHSSVLFRRDALERAGGHYDPALWYAEDLDLWLRLGEFGLFANIPEYVTGYRLTGHNVSTVKRQSQLYEVLKLIRKYSIRYPRSKRALAYTWIKMILNAVTFSVRF